MFPSSSTQTKAFRYSFNKSKTDQPSCGPLIAIVYAEKGRASIPGPSKRQPRGKGSSLALPASVEGASRYTFGTAPDSDIHLRGKCYVQRLHLEIYRDPDRPQLWLRNPAGPLTFKAKTVATSSAKLLIRPGCEEAIGRGTWRVLLGQALVLRLQVLCSQPDEPTTLYTKILSNHFRDKSNAVALYSDHVQSHRSTDGGRPKEPRDIACSPIQSKANPKAEAHNNPKLVHPESPNKEPASKVEKSMTQSSETGTIAVGFYNTAKEPIRPSAGGASAEVCFYKCQGRYIAIKTYREQSVSHAYRNWLKEARVLDMIGSHPKIVKLLEKSERTFSFVFEDAGQDIAFASDSKGMSTLDNKCASKIFFDVVEALDYIHGKRIVHMDIKPSNIIFNSRTLGAKLCDFGLSRTVDELLVNRSGGTPCYIPPEYMFDGTDRGAGTDIWALGVTMLYAFRQIPKPCLSWLIEAREDPSCIRIMKEWLNIIAKAQERLPERLSVLRKLLEVSPAKRVTASCLLGELRDRSQLALELTN